jgi:hypothetical protein
MDLMKARPEVTIDSHEVLGRVEVRRVGRIRFPVYELAQGDVVLASMGRTSWIKVFMGRGQRIKLADGSEWRLKSLGSAGAVCPAILDEDKRKIALSSVGAGGYGINGKAFGFMFYRGEKKRFSRANRWILRHYEDEIAIVVRYPAAIDASEPVHLGAVLLAFSLVRYGILGEFRPRLKFQWT